MLKVTGVKPLDGYTLEIEFNDGAVRVVGLRLPAAWNARRAVEEPGLLPAGPSRR